MKITICLSSLKMLNELYEYENREWAVYKKTNKQNVHNSY